MELKNNTILITGGTSGFGLEFAKKIMLQGNKVIITGRNQTKLDEVKKNFPAVTIFRSDVSDPNAIKELFEKITVQFPNLNILINNAGIMRVTNLLSTASNTDDNIFEEIDINFTGPIRMVQQFLPHLIKQKNAAILNVTSGIAILPLPAAPIYSATKSGLRSYTMSLRIQLKNTNVKVFELVAPGSNTALNQRIKEEVNAKDDPYMMPAEKVVEKTMEYISHDKYDIVIGASKFLQILNKFAPKLGLKMMSRSL